MIEFAKFWLPIIGAGIFITWGISAWYGQNKTLAIWLIFAGVVFLLLLGAIQLQEAVDRQSPTQEKPSAAEIIAQRAYISAENFLVENLLAGAETRFRYQAINRGKTPAYNVRFFGIVKLLPYPLPSNFAALNIPDDNAVKLTIPNGVAQQGSKLIDVRLTTEDIEAIVNGTERQLYFIGVIRYNDVFTLAHETRFCVSVGGPILRAILAEAKPNTDFATVDLFHFCDRFNDAT